jgi:hypothetical protein
VLGLVGREGELAIGTCPLMAEGVVPRSGVEGLWVLVGRGTVLKVEILEGRKTAIVVGGDGGIACVLGGQGGHGSDLE